MRFAVAAALVLASVTASARPPQIASTEIVSDSPDAQFARGQKSYNKGDYQQTIDELRPLLYPTVQLGSDDEIRARKKLAMSYFIRDNQIAAEREFETLLQLNPNFTMDTVVDPPAAIDFFAGIQKRERDKLEEMIRRSKEEELERKRVKDQQEREAKDALEAAQRALKPKIVEKVVVKVIEQHHLVYAFVPFGVGQFQNRALAKGWFFFVSQALLGAASLATFATLSYNQTSNVTITYVPVMLGAAFWLDAIVGIVDALANYRSQIVLEDPAATSAPAKLGLMPFVAPSGGGLTLQGAF